VPSVERKPSYRGERLGLPASGPGSLAPTGRRILAFLVDALTSSLVAALFVRRSDLSGPASHLPGSWSVLAFFIEYVVGVVLLGRSLGMYVTGLRVIRVDRRVAVGPLRAAGRAALLILLVPALITDADFRGLHDRLTSTAVIVH
jgi:uncharacterized RDD family membrane protein YckC